MRWEREGEEWEDLWGEGRIEGEGQMGILPSSLVPVCAMLS